VRLGLPRHQTRAELATQPGRVKAKGSFRVRPHRIQDHETSKLSGLLKPRIARRHPQVNCAVVSSNVARRLILRTSRGAHPDAKKTAAAGRENWHDSAVLASARVPPANAQPKMATFR